MGSMPVSGCVLSPTMEPRFRFSSTFVCPRLLFSLLVLLFPRPFAAQLASAGPPTFRILLIKPFFVAWYEKLVPKKNAHSGSVQRNRKFFAVCHAEADP